MNGWILPVLLAAAGLLALAPAPADAQVGVEVQIYWRWGDDGWRPQRPTHRPDRGYAYPRHGGVVRYPVRYQPVRVPPGHLPPPGSCRLWYPGRPPGHQPPPQPCGRLLITPGAHGAVIIGAPAHPGSYGPGPGWERRGRGGKERGRGRGRGRGGRGG